MSAAVATARPVETWLSVVFRADCVCVSDCSALRAEALVRIELIKVLLSVKSRNRVTFRICTETTKRPYAFSPQNAGTNRRVTPKPVTAKRGPTRFSPTQTATRLLRLGKPSLGAPNIRRLRQRPLHPGAPRSGLEGCGGDPCSILRLARFAGGSGRGSRKAARRAQCPRKLRRRICGEASRTPLGSRRQGVRARAR